eukprot:3042424-Amphidinium_carterae.1
MLATGSGRKHAAPEAATLTPQSPQTSAKALAQAHQSHLCTLARFVQTYPNACCEAVMAVGSVFPLRGQVRFHWYRDAVLR